MKNNTIQAYKRKKRRLYAQLKGKWTECIICGAKWNLGQPKQYVICSTCNDRRAGWLALIPARMVKGKLIKRGQTLMLPGNAIHLLMRNSEKFIGQEMAIMKPKMVRALRKKYNLMLENMENETAPEHKG